MRRDRFCVELTIGIETETACVKFLQIPDAEVLNLVNLVC